MKLGGKTNFTHKHIYILPMFINVTIMNIVAEI